MIVRTQVLILVVLTAALLLPTSPIPAQTDNFVEAWRLYEQGKAKLADPDGPELGEALLAFQEAIERRGGTFPEAELAIGDIYFQEGAFGLAKRQYEKAYELRGGMEVAEEIRSKIEQAKLSMDDIELNPTISIGVAVYPDDAKEVLDLVARADSALYRAKAKGKNVVSN